MPIVQQISPTIVVGDDYKSVIPCTLSFEIDDPHQAVSFA